VRRERKQKGKRKEKEKNDTGQKWAGIATLISA
jgi:hypothetical protein